MFYFKEQNISFFRKNILMKRKNYETEFILL